MSYLKRKIQLTFTIILILAVQSCNKSTEFTNKVFIVQSITSGIGGLKIENGVGNKSINISSAHEVTEDVKVQLKVLDSNFLTEYNKTNSRSFYLLSDSAYKISSTNLTIQQGKALADRVDIAVDLKTWKSYRPGRQYVIPIKIENVSGAGIVSGQEIIIIQLEVVTNSNAILIDTNDEFTAGLTIPVNAFKDPKTQKLYDQYTFEARFNYSGFFDKNGAANVWFNVLFSGPGVWTIVSSSGNFHSISSIPYLSEITPKTWYHIAIVYDKGLMTWYLNGNRVHVANTKAELTQGTFGWNSSSSKVVFNQVKLWKTARSARLIKDFMCAADPKDPDLSAYYPLSSLTNFALDITGNGNNLILGDNKSVLSLVNNVKCPL